MPAEPPTTLVVPEPSPAPGPPQSSVIPAGLVVSGVVLMIIAGVVFSRRRARRMDPRELAFRTIVQKLGYSRSQIKAIRQAALGAGLTSPVGIVMNPSLCDREPATPKGERSLLRSGRG